MNTFSQADHEAIRRFTYQGGDSSLLYKYVLSPIAQYLVDKVSPFLILRILGIPYLFKFYYDDTKWTPSTLAPNAITLIGLSFVGISLTATFIWNPSLGPEAPRWLHLLSGVCLFIYQTLDNMDGKQARKTGSSSPLGMLFDHGCDAINSSITTVTIGSVFGLGWTLRMLVFGMLCGQVVLFFATWEEHYVGMFVLPLINGPSDGLAIAVSICLLSALYGAHWWTQTLTALPLTSPPSLWQRWLQNVLLFDKEGAASRFEEEGTIPLSPFSMFYLFTVFCVACTVGNNIFNVLRSVVSAPAGEESGHRRNLLLQRILKAFADVSHFLVYLCSIFYYFYRKRPYIQSRAPLMLVYMASTFSEITSHTMLAHICDRPIEPWGRHLAWLSLSLPLFVWLQDSGYVDVEEERVERGVLMLLAAYAFTVALLNLYSIFTQMADCLGIYIFRIDKKKPGKRS